MSKSAFYLGRSFDAKSASLTTDNVNYDADDLTTHAVVVGMTGSGKTGLCIGLLEEAALNGVPAVIVDPKGDLTNLLLHFPDLLPQDFQPWIDPEIARRANKTPEQAAMEAATSWRKGIQEWGMTPERILDLKNSADFAVYTPGSTAGLPISVLSTLEAPALSWETESEILRERISSAVTALLGLAGLNDLDPISSRERILLANIFEDHWRNGKALDLKELILQIQNPDVKEFGAFSVDSFFPPKDRTTLAMTINSILAAPTFEAWREGQALDVQALLFKADGTPRHSIFYLAHLSDSERMFFTTLLFSAVETWMRTQKGSNALRAILYMDEIYGYLPPTANPPSKQPLLRMLKQARAFGLGILLATQNPVDLDYKALSNAGTWFIGKLQTERDKLRLLDGLESLAGGFSRAEMDKLISSLGKRVFVMNNVHDKAPTLFQTRWAMNFLAGPLTRSQIRDLNALVGVQTPAPQTPPTQTQPSAPSFAPQPLDRLQPIPAVTAATQAAPIPQAAPSSAFAGGSATKPALPAGVREYYLPQNHSLAEAYKAEGKSQAYGATIQGVIYKPILLASAQVRVLDRKYGVDADITKTALVNQLDNRGIVRWEDFPYAGPALDKLEIAPTPSAKYDAINPPLNDSKLMTALQKDFADWVVRNSSVTARANETLKVYAGPDVSSTDFMKACADAARDLRDADISKKTAALDKKIKTLEDKLVREERELRQDQENLRNRNIETGLSGAETLAGLFGIGRKKSLSTSVSKYRMAQNAREEVRESEEAIAQFNKEIADLRREREQTTKEITDRWGAVVNDINEVSVSPKKTDVYVNLFGVAWKPYYVVQAGGETLELSAFGAD
ncbi:MAG: DUF87 domain-containing protein [Anaerolineales bacterium]|nr:DUF87 domain-containing protein [Anaerolineales bacterium]